MKSRASARVAWSHGTPTAQTNRNHRNRSIPYDRSVIDAVAVELVDHTGLQRDPRVGRAVVAAALAGPEQRDLLLRPADEQHALGPGEGGQELLGHVVLALALGEVDPGDLPLGGEGPHRPGERLGHRCQRRSGRHWLALVPADKTYQPGCWR